jgi:hypothetical protein
MPLAAIPVSVAASSLPQCPGNLVFKNYGGDCFAPYNPRGSQRRINDAMPLATTKNAHNTHNDMLEDFHRLQVFPYNYP